MANRKRVIQQNDPSPSYVLNRLNHYIPNENIESTNIQIAAYRGPNNDFEYYSKIALLPFALDGFVDDLPDAINEHPGAPKICNLTIEQLRGRVKWATGEMVQGSIGEVRVSFPTMRGIVSYGLFRRPVASDANRGSVFTVYLNHKGKLTEIYSRPTELNMLVKRATYERVPHAN